jgi:glycine cleavage system transcriptional repressor
MKEHLLFSLIGTDRTGLVDKITETIAKSKGNVEGSRMAVLGGEFAMLLLVSIPSSQRAALEADVQKVAASLELTLHIKTTTPRKTNQGTVPLLVKVRGMDNEGLVHQVTKYLAGFGSSVDTLDSEVEFAPHSGTSLFSMDLTIHAPASVSLASLRKGLQEVGDRLNVDIDLSAAKD